MRPDRGFAAIAALFMLVVLALLGVALVTISGAQQRSQAFDVLGMKAYQSAHAGLDAAIAKILATGSCPAAAPAFPLPGATELQGFYVNVSCTQPLPPYNDAGGTLTMFEITATACNNATCPSSGGVENYVERELRATVCQGTAC
jgi:MSHA biogenesis protein MshP